MKIKANTLNENFLKNTNFLLELYLIFSLLSAYLCWSEKISDHLSLIVSIINFPSSILPHYIFDVVDESPSVNLLVNQLFPESVFRNHCADVIAILLLLGCGYIQWFVLVRTYVAMILNSQTQKRNKIILIAIPSTLYIAVVILGFAITLFSTGVG